VQYSKYEYMKGVDHADQYLGCYSVDRKAVKWSKKVLLFLLNCALFNLILVYKTLNKGTKIQSISS